MAMLAITYDVLAIPLAIASIIAIQCAIVTNFTGHHLFTFQGTHGSLLKRFVTFETISISTAALSWAVLNGLALIFGTDPPLVVYAYNLIAIAVSFLANFTLNVSSTWKDHEPDRAKSGHKDSIP